MIRTEYYWPSQNPLENVAVGDWVSCQIWGKPGQINEFSTMAIYDGDDLIAATAYHNWHQDSGIMELSSAAVSRRWLTRPVINAMFRFPFEIMGCQMVVLRVSERNTNMVHIARSFGFTEVLIPRLRGRDENEFIFTLTDDQWASSPYRRG